MPTLIANGEEIYYEAAGAGPAVLLLHSLGSSSHAWAGELQRFAGQYRVIAPDCRGHGRSTHHGVVSLDAIVDDLLALLDALRVEQVHVAGLSMGGGQALRLYERAPQRVQSIVLADTFATYGRERAEARLQDTAAKLQRQSMAEFGRDYAYAALLPGTPEAAKQALAAVIAGMAPEAYQEAASACFLADLEHVLPRIAVPTLVLVGDRDNRTPPAWSQAMARAIPGARYAEVEGAGHLCNLDQPEGFAAALCSFWASLG